MPLILNLHSVSLVISFSVRCVIAHPVFDGQIISRADELLPCYDYVVVGAGASGLTVANRLSEDSKISVLVIEAGDLDKNEAFVTIPGLAGGAIGTKYDWNTSYAAAEGLRGRRNPIPQGKVVGGSTKLNRMVFDRGSKSDYDGWEELTYKRWNFTSLLPYFKKNENFTPPTAEIAAEYDIKFDSKNHGDKGYMQTTYSPFFWPTTKNLVRATKSLGIPINDQATGNAIGGYFCPHNLNSKDMSRSSAEEAYYASAVARSNFHLLVGNQVSRILTTKREGSVQVAAVEFARNKKAKRKTVKVKKEAILAAGALHTPQLLQVSGIGDSAHLESINVTTVVDLPAVGHNLQDHLYVAVVNALSTNVLTNALSSNTTFAAQAMKEYVTQKQGPLTSPTGDFLLFLPLSTYSNATKDILSQAIAGGVNASLPVDRPSEVARGYAAQYASLNKKLIANDSAFLEIIWADGVIVLGLQHPYSRGSVKAVSSSVFDAPIADAGFLRNPVDVILLREALHFARQLVRTREISELNPTEVVPGVNVTSDADIDSWIRGTASTLYHPAGSCKLGPKKSGGVVNDHLKVYGVEGLRIVDASIIPMLPASHTMTTVYALAEKAADIIKGSGAYKTTP